MISRSAIRPVAVRLALASLLGFAAVRADMSPHAEEDAFLAEVALIAPEEPIVGPAAATAPAERVFLGEWGAPIQWIPHIPVTACSLPDGRILTFASNQRTTFPSGSEFTYAAVWNPATGAFTEINNPRHDMFCGATSMLPDGRLVVNGGRATTVLSSIFDWRTNQWSAIQNMNDPRWYNTSVAMTDGTVFTVSGSGGLNTAERWTAATGWRRLTGINWESVTLEPGYITIWHPFVIVAPDGRLFHFGPTDTMHWVDPSGSGSMTSSGILVPGAHYPKEGSWAMYDAGKIFVVGGGANTTPEPGANSTDTSSTTAYTVDLNGATPVVKTRRPMLNARQFANAVILPTGEVMVIGGNTTGQKFSDAGTVFVPELWNPITDEWRSFAPMTVPRNYHSVALLLPDGRVWAAGGGLSGGSGDHQDAEVFTPPYLFKSDGSPAVRPVITQAPARIFTNVRYVVQATPGLSRFSFVKMSSITHSVNTDLRYHSIPFSEVSPGRYELVSRSTLNVMTPGYWMLFGLDSQSVYSTGRVMQVSATPIPSATNPGNQSSVAGEVVSLQIHGAAPNGAAVSYAATGLPPGLGIGGQSGVVSGTPTMVGNYNCTVTVSDGAGNSEVLSFSWTVIPGVALTPISSTPKPAGTAISYTVQMAGGTNPRVKWSWGDGTADTAYSALTSGSHTFALPGRYLVTVTGTDDSGALVTTSFRQGVHAVLTPRKPAHSGNIAYEMRVTGSPRLWVVNQDNDSVGVFDAVTRARLAETPVGSGPRCVGVAPDGRVWVTNAGSATISILNPSTFGIAQTLTLPRGSKPFGLAFDPNGSAAYVTLEAAGALLKLNPTTGAQTASLPLGEHMRGLAVSADGTKLFVSRFVTPPLPGESTASVQTELGPTKFGGQVLSVNTATMTLVRTVILQHSERTDSSRAARGIPNYLGAPVISPDNQVVWVPSKQDNIKRGALRDGRPLTHDSTLRSVASRIALPAETEDLDGWVDFDDGGIASAAAFDPWGLFVFVALEGSREVAVVDAWNKQEILRIATARAPQGLVVSPDGRTLYVHNFMERTVTVHDLGNLLGGGQAPIGTLASIVTVGTERLTAAALAGKRHFYDSRDSRISLQQYISCAACHHDGGDDGRVWDFTGFGEGLRNTIGLAGKGGMAQGPLHWTGNFDEVQDFEGQLRGLDAGIGLMTDADFHAGARSQPLGTPKGGLSADLDALAAYLGSLTSAGASPDRAADLALPAGALAGRSLFKSLQCASCHSGAGFTISSLNVFRDVGTIKPASGQRLGVALSGLDVPGLRGAWATAPYLHDGSASSVAQAIAAHSGITLGATDLANIAAYVRQIDDSIGIAPVPLTVTLSAPAATVASPFSVQVAFLPAPVGVGLGNFVVTNGTAGGFSGSGSSYSFTVTPVVAGPVTVALPAGAVQDGDGDANLASNLLTVTYGSGGTLQPGLKGEYFSGEAFGALVATRTDSTIDFFWPDTTAPAPGVPGDYFSVRWTGRVQPQFSESHRFWANCDDGVRIWVDGQLLLDNWNPTPNTYFDLQSAAISLVASQYYDFKVEFQDFFSDAWAQISWSSPSRANQIIPANRLFLPGVPGGGGGDTTPPMAALSTPLTTVSGQFVVNAAFSEPVLGLAAADFVVTNASTGALSGSGSNWSVPVVPSAAGAVTIRLPAGACSDASGNGSVASNLLSVVYAPLPQNRPPAVTNPGAQSVTRGQTVTLPIQASDSDGNALTFMGSGLPPGLSIHGGTGLISGTVATSALAGYSTTVTAFDGALSGSAVFSWTVSDPQTSVVPGLKGEYFSGDEFATPVTSRIDNQIHFFWPDTSSPAAGVPGDYFSVRWTGRIKPPTAGSWQFFADCDDGIRVWVNGVQVISAWNPPPETYFGLTGPSVPLTAGQMYEIKVEFQDFFSDAYVVLKWQGPGVGEQVVPAGAFFHPANSGPTSGPLVVANSVRVASDDLARTEASMTVTASPGGMIGFSFVRLAGLADAYAVETSADCASWRILPTTPAWSVITQSDGTERVEIPAVFGPMGPMNPCVFFRVRTLP